MPRPKITFKSTVLDLELENVEFTVGPETMKIGRLKASLDVADLLRVQLPKLVNGGVEGVMLLDCGQKKIQCIKQVRGFTGWGLKESKEFVESAPILLKVRGRDHDLAGSPLPSEFRVTPLKQAEEVARALQEIGATVEIVHGKEHIPTVLDRFREMLVEALSKEAKVS